MHSSHVDCVEGHSIRTMRVSVLAPLRLACLLLALTPRCWSHEPWVGSRLGTEKYNREIDAIDQAKIDYKWAMAGKPRKPLLCVTFLAASLEIPKTLLRNMEIMGSSCQWAIVMYDGNEAEVKAVCSHVEVATQTVLCLRSVDSISLEKKSTPKTVLYQSLLPVLPDFEKVFLMDEDISLEGFDSTIFMKIWSCAFKQRPLIVQPLVVESNQFLVYVNEKPWREAPWDDVDASRVGYIEQQVPLFDSIFFEWFVKRVLSQTKQWSMEYGIDWGHDRSWCNAAQMYARDVLHWPIVRNATEGQVPQTAPPCALITQQGTGVHHLNGKTMRIIRGNVAIFRKHAFMVVQKYVLLFPTWVGMDMLEPNNPLSEANKHKFEQVRALNGTCAR